MPTHALPDHDLPSHDLSNHDLPNHENNVSEVPRRHAEPASQSLSSANDPGASTPHGRGAIIAPVDVIADFNN